jgi:hypothetical protein
MQILVSPPGTYYAGQIIPGIEVKNYPLTNVVDLIANPTMKSLFIKQVLIAPDLGTDFLRSLMPDYDAFLNIYLRFADDKSVNHKFDYVFLARYLKGFKDKYSNIDQNYDFSKKEYALFEKMADILKSVSDQNSIPPAIKQHIELGENKKKFLSEFDDKFRDQVGILREQVNSSEGEAKVNKEAKLKALENLRMEIFKYSTNDTYTFDDLVQKAAVVAIHTNTIKHIGFFNSTFGGKSKTDVLISDFVEKAKKFNVQPQAEVRPASPGQRK